MKIRQKLALLVAVPLVAVLVFAALTVVTTGGEALQAERIRNLVKGNAAVGDLVYQLQTERTLAVQTLVDDSGEGAEKYLNHTKKTDKAIRAYNKAKDKLTDVPGSTADVLDRIEDELEELRSVRDRVSKSQQTASSAAFVYRIIIADLLSYRETVPQAGNVPSDVADRIRASNLLARSTEYLSIETETVLRSIDWGEMTPSAFQKITAANTGATEATLSFNALAPAQWRGWLEQSQAGNKVSEARTLEDEALRTQPGSEIDIEPDKWVTNMLDRAEKYQGPNGVQERIDGEVVDEITTLRDEQFRLTAAQLGGVVLAVIIALILALWLGGPVVRGLRRLRDSAHQVATVGLPRAVAELDDQTALGDQTPEEFASRATPPVKTKGRDELADVGQAFNEVHQEAIRVAARQALMRLHIGGMFVRLARRGHSLAGRLTNVLDEAERNEQDPDRLDRLFKLDHLVTLFGRTNDSLLVLGGAAPARPRRTNAAVGDVLTAAQSQIEQYTRVQIGIVDDGVSISANAVDDVVKLLAELLDNATQYSDRPVNVAARLLADRLVIQISDRGMGIPPERIEQLNARLATRNPLDLDSMQTMGLTVVGHIASQHDISVELRRAAVGGTLAEVSLPVDIVVPHAPPKEITAGPETPEVPTGSRNAPLFKRRERRERSQESSNTDNNRRRPTTAGLPQVRFDFGAVPVDPGHPPTAEPVAPQAQPQDRQRPRQMSFGRNREFDAGWQAAERATAPEASATDDGLPKREPMARLVPGAVGPPTQEIPATDATPAYRDPVSVGAAYVAYAKTRPGKRSVTTSADDSRNAT